MRVLKLQAFEELQQVLTDFRYLMWHTGNVMLVSIVMS